MWISFLDLRWQRVVPTRLLGRVWRNAYIASFAPLQVQNVPRQPLPATNWVRVRNRLAGISGYDLQLLSGESGSLIASAALPSRGRIYPGSEVVGEVIEVGEDVQDLAVGDRVALAYGPNCLSAGVQPLCRSCANGNYALCERGNLPGPFPVGGGWSEEMLVHEQQLFRLPPDLTDEQAVMLESTSIALHAVLRCPPRPGDRVLIIGSGTIGLLVLQAIRALTPRAEISVLARYPFQVEQATRLGATHIIYPQDSYAEVERATEAHLYQGLLGNKMLLGGYDIIFDTVGTPHTLHDALRWARADGAIVLIGIYKYLMQLDLTPLWNQEIKLFGSYGHGSEHWPLSSINQSSTFSISAELMQRDLAFPERLITHRFALNDYRHALATALHKSQSRALKVVFDYALQPVTVVPNVRASRPKNFSSTDIPIVSAPQPMPSTSISPTTPPPTIEPEAPSEPEPPEEQEQSTLLRPPKLQDEDETVSFAPPSSSDATNEPHSAFPSTEDAPSSSET
jgi:threonine dehydrogenase-like Zn-dependent dehydrogenase